jgi:hypothetical protein
MIFSVLSGIGKYFIGHALCNSDDSVMQLVHILHFFMINSFLFKPSEKKHPEESNLEKKGAREWVSLFVSNSQDSPFP